MLHSITLSTKGYGGSVPATQHALYKMAVDIADREDRIIRGIYYEKSPADPHTGFSMVRIKIWFH